MWVAILAIIFGIFFTHRIFVIFILELFALYTQVQQGIPIERHKYVEKKHLAWQAMQIALGIIPLLWGVTHFINP